MRNLDPTELVMFLGVVVLCVVFVIFAAKTQPEDYHHLEIEVYLNEDGEIELTHFAPGWSAGVSDHSPDGSRQKFWLSNRP